MNNNHNIVTIAIFLLLGTYHILHAQDNVESKKLHQLFEKEWAFRISDNPELGSYVGVESANEKLSKIGIPHEQRRMQYWKDCLKELQEIDQKQLSKKDRINASIFKYQLEDLVANIENEAYLIPLTAEGGFYNNILYTLRGSNFNKEADYINYLSRLKAIEQYLDDHMKLLKIGVKKGKTLPQIIAKNHPNLIKPFLNKKANQHPFYKILAGAKNVPPAYLEACELVVQSNILPAYQRLNQYFEEQYIPNCRTTLGATSMPGGKAYYDQRVQFYTTLNLDANQIFELGQTEVNRIRKEMTNIIDDLNFKGSFEDFLKFLRTDSQFYADSPEQLLKEASWIAKKMDGKLPEYFNTLPRLPYGVEPVPEAIAPNYTAGRYSEGSVKNHKAGHYWVNTYKLESRPLYVLPALTLHEAVPGHHLQISLAQEMDNLPPFRQYTYLSCYGEGWALYCEWLGEEMGMYETPYEKFGKLTYEMWRACRLVVDVGLHAKNWTRQEAVDFLASNTALSIHEVNTEIDRYIGWPGQALSYKMGELKIRELRTKATKELGEKFDLRAFHDLILLDGAVPLFVLEEMVNEWIAEQL